MDFTNPKTVLVELIKHAERVLGVPVDYNFLKEAINDLLRKKHKAYYDERIRHLNAERLTDMLELISLESPEEELCIEAEEENEAGASEDETLSEVSKESRDTSKGSGNNKQSAFR